MRILLAGTHRCGSTWVANVLRRTRGLQIVYEPDEPGTDILGMLSSDRLGRYPALRPADEIPRYSTIWDLAFAGGWPWRPSPSRKRIGKLIRKVPAPIRTPGLALLARATTRTKSRSHPEHVLVKSANCALAVEWIEQRYRPQVVVQYRNPLNLVSSWLALSLEGDITLAEDPVVRERLLQPFDIPVLASESSRVARVAWTVGILNLALKVAASAHPDWIVISHDKLCEDPDAEFPALCSRLGLTWGPEAAAYLQASDRPGFVDPRRNPRNGPEEQTTADMPPSRRVRQADQYRRRLSESQVAEARDILAAFPLGDWAPAPDHAQR